MRVRFSVLKGVTQPSAMNVCMYSYIEKANQNEMSIKLVCAGKRVDKLRMAPFIASACSRLTSSYGSSTKLIANKPKSSLSPPSLPLYFLSHLMSDVCAPSLL